MARDRPITVQQLRALKAQVDSGMCAVDTVRDIAMKAADSARIGSEVAAAGRSQSQGPKDGAAAAPGRSTTDNKQSSGGAEVVLSVNARDHILKNSGTFPPAPSTQIQFSDFSRELQQGAEFRMTGAVFLDQKLAGYIHDVPLKVHKRSTSTRSARCR